MVTSADTAPRWGRESVTFQRYELELEAARETERVEALAVRPPIGELEAGLGVDALEALAEGTWWRSRSSSPRRRPNGTSMSSALEVDHLVREGAQPDIHPEVLRIPTGDVLE